jgi:hypothetical protein
MKAANQNTPIALRQVNRDGVEITLQPKCVGNGKADGYRGNKRIYEYPMGIETRYDVL